MVPDPSAPRPAPTPDAPIPAAPAAPDAGSAPVDAGPDPDAPADADDGGTVDAVPNPPSDDATDPTTDVAPPAQSPSAPATPAPSAKKPALKKKAKKKKKKAQKAKLPQPAKPTVDDQALWKLSTTQAEGMVAWNGKALRTTKQFDALLNRIHAQPMTMDDSVGTPHYLKNIELTIAQSIKDVHCGSSVCRHQRAAAGLETTAPCSYV